MLVVHSPSQKELANLDTNFPDYLKKELSNRFRGIYFSLHSNFLEHESYPDLFKDDVHYNKFGHTEVSKKNLSKSVTIC